MTVATPADQEKAFQQLSLSGLRTAISAPIKQIGAQYRTFVIEDLSIDPSCSLKPWRNGNRWLTVSDSNKERARISIPQHVWSRAINKGYEITNEASIDVAIETLFVDKRQQIQIEAMAVRVSGQSQLEAKREAINKYCEERGYFTREKLPLPVIITRLAIITTEYSDIESDITRQTGMRKDLITPYRFDGSPAGLKNTLASVIKEQRYDIIALYRGGREDEPMFVFSDPIVLDEIVASPVPIASALGHERDIPPVQRVVSLGCASPSKFALYVKERNEQAWAEAYQLTKEINSGYQNYLERLKAFVYQQYSEIKDKTGELQRLADRRKHRRNMIALALVAAGIVAFVVWYFN